MILPEHSRGAILESKFVRLLSNPAFLCLLLSATTLFVFWPATRCDFLNYDDPDYFTSNPHVLSGLTMANFKWAFTTGFASNWHPLTWFSLMLDAQVFGKNSFGPHFTNLLFHALNAALLFLLLRKLTGALWRSVLVAALFALHPFHVESVAWVSERKDVLSVFFGLLTLYFYGESKAKTPGPKAPHGLTLLFFAFALMSKAMLVTLPFVMLLLDFWPLKRVECGDLKIAGSKESPNFQLSIIFEKWPFLSLAAVVSAVTFLVQKNGGAVAGLAKVPLPLRIENAFVSYACYFGKAFWPQPLANPYPLPKQWPLEMVLPSVVLFCALCAAAIVLARKFPFVFTGWFWFVGTLIPVIGLVQVGDAAMADRYTYFPLIGIFIILAWGAGEICANRRAPKPIVVFFAAMILAACAFRTRDQLGYWQNNEIFFRHTLAVTKDNYTAYNNLGTWLAKKGQTAEAMDCFFKSLQINQDDSDVLYNLGNAFASLGNWDEATDYYRRSLEISPDHADVLDNLGFALAAKKQFDQAVPCLEKALQLDPDSADAHNNLATVYFREQRFDEAAQHYREAVRISPDNPQLYANLGDTLARQNKISEAVQNYQTALRLNPGDARTKAKLQALGAQISN